MQPPRILSVPDYDRTLGTEAVQLAREAGLVLDPWQALVLEHALGVRAGKWAAFEVGLVVPRQNGKGAILEARELAGLFLIGERLLIHSAHQFDTSLEAFRRLLFLIEDNPDFDRRVRRVSRSHGEEGIELKGGQRIRFRTRTKGGGRGFSGDFLALDEAMILPEFSHSALLPTLSARPNPQVFYAGSAVDQTIHQDGVVLARIRDRGLAGADPSLAYFEWSVDAATPADLPPDVLESEAAARIANPGMDTGRVTFDYVRKERASMSARGFAVERLGAGDWPLLDVEGAVIPIEQWASLTDARSRTPGRVCFAWDVSPSRNSAAIGVAGLRKDGLLHVEVVDRRPGTGWVAARLAEIVGRNDCGAVIYDEGAAGASLVPEITTLGVEVQGLTAREYARACGMFYDRAVQATLRHLGTAELADALRVATKRPLGEAWAWDRRTSLVEISPLVAVTLAGFGAATMAPPRAAPRLL